MVSCRAFTCAASAYAQSGDDNAETEHADHSAAADELLSRAPTDDQLHYHAAVLDLQASPFEFRVLEVRGQASCDGRAVGWSFPCSQHRQRMSVAFEQNQQLGSPYTSHDAPTSDPVPRWLSTRCAANWSTQSQTWSARAAQPSIDSRTRRALLRVASLCRPRCLCQRRLWAASCQLCPHTRRRRLRQLHAR